MNKEFKYTDLGLLLLRIGIGAMFIAHGWGKLIGGHDKWMKVGEKVSLIGIEFGHVFFGFMAAFAETFGGLFLILGVLWIPANLLLLMTMIVATNYHIVNEDSFPDISHSAEAGILFLALILIGPGKYRLFNR
jgi:putative oxidoreductase